MRILKIEDVFGKRKKSRTKELKDVVFFKYSIEV